MFLRIKLESENENDWGIQNQSISNQFDRNPIIYMFLSSIPIIGKIFELIRIISNIGFMFDFGVFD